MSVLCEDGLDWASLLTQRSGTSALFDTIVGMAHSTRDSSLRLLYLLHKVVNCDWKSQMEHSYSFKEIS
jgi:hypothetical protein